MAGKTALLADIGGFYAAFGLEVAGGQPDVEDHIATELEFLSALALKEAWAIAEHHGDHADVSHDAGLAFLRDHLARWAPAFTDALEAAAALDYYRAVARLLRAWVDADVRRLGVTVEPLAPGAAAGAEGGEPFTCPMTGGE
jgi:TorA maturation chaperone TorD